MALKTKKSLFFKQTLKRFSPLNISHTLIMKKLIIITKTIILLATLSLSAFSQKIEISGQVISAEDDNSIPGVSISVLGTTRGTFTDANGQYTISIDSMTDSILFSYIGHENQVIAVTDDSYKNVKLKEQTSDIEEVVVTALGIKREKKSLGYSVQELSGDEMKNSKQFSAINSLSGKVAGLSVSATNGGPASSSRIVLRGNNSFNNNQALIVVDGVPINNSTVSNSEDEWGGKDFGNGVSDINPEDIESVSVLKGASAAALYGSQAANGVIIITTSKASKRKLSVSVSSSVIGDRAFIQKEFQNTYGAGSNGKFETHWEINENGTPVYMTERASNYSSWGPKMEGQNIIDWTGSSAKFSPQDNNYESFFNTGYTLSNSLALEYNMKYLNLKLSAADMRNNDIIPNSDTRRNNLGLNFGSNLSKKIKISGYVSYVNQQANNRPSLSDGHTNIARNYIMMPRDISNSSLESYYEDEDGNERTWYETWNWMTNPYWNKKYELSMDKKERVFGNISINYQIMKSLNLMLRTAQDFSNTHFEEIGASQGMIHPTGYYGFRDIKSHLSNSDFLMTYNKQVSKFSLIGSFGGNARYDEFESYSSHTTNGLTKPAVYDIENSAGIAKTDDLLPTLSAVNSLYFLGQVSYNGFMFVDFTGRNDWNSTLPKNNNSYYYPSYNFSFVFSELFPKNNKLNSIFPYGKIRLSTAKVGSGAEKYQLYKTYYTNDNDVYGTYAILNNQIPPSNLKPEELTSYEAGTDLRFFNNRLALDFTYYHTNSINQIVSIDIPSGSGAKKALINAGNIENKGIELQIKATPVQTKNFNWVMIVNYTKNKSEVIELAEGVENHSLLEHWGLSIEARPGNPYGDIVGYGIQKDKNGNKLINANGMYLRTEHPVVLGNVNPDYSVSLSNSFSYKNLSFNFLIDAKVGGDMFSGTNMYMHGYSGNAIATIDGRDEWYSSEEAREAAGILPEDWVATGGYLAEGVYQKGTLINGENLGGQTNQTYVNPFDYWHQYANWTNEIHEPFIYDASFVKLRETSINYSLSKKTVAKLKIQSVRFSVIGRNLWLIHSNVPNVDPESFHTNGNGQGYELYSYPTRKSVGFSFNLTF